MGLKALNYPIFMARPRVDSRLQNIESGIDEIKNKLCEMSPFNSEITENNEEEDSESES